MNRDQLTFAQAIADRRRATTHCAAIAEDPWGAALIKVAGAGDAKAIADGWRLRRAELEDFAQKLAEALARTDSTFDKEAFLRVALAEL